MPAHPTSGYDWDNSPSNRVYQLLEPVLDQLIGTVLGVSYIVVVRRDSGGYVSITHYGAVVVGELSMRARQVLAHACDVVSGGSEVCKFVMCMRPTEFQCIVQITSPGFPGLHMGQLLRRYEDETRLRHRLRVAPTRLDLPAIDLALSPRADDPGGDVPGLQVVIDAALGVRDSRIRWFVICVRWRVNAVSGSIFGVIPRPATILHDYEEQWKLPRTEAVRAALRDVVTACGGVFGSIDEEFLLILVDDPPGTGRRVRLSRDIEDALMLLSATECERVRAKRRRKR